MQKTFKEKVLIIVRAIPTGATMSYKAVAARAGNARSARAVARIMATNFAATVPCHRVIRSDGQLGGYNRGGEDKKRAILQDESRKRNKK